MYNINKRIVYILCVNDKLKLKHSKQVHCTYLYMLQLPCSCGSRQGKDASLISMTYLP